MVEKELKLEEGLKEVVEATKEFFKRIKEDTNRSLTVLTKKGEIRSIKEAKEGKLRQLGDLVYKKTKKGELTLSPEIQSIVDDIEKLEKKLKKKEKELAKLTKEIGKKDPHD
ncbi:MAG: hypothetical protein J7L64_04455 [Acidobacteria bacterium]|nr:hypothetical protein [Acidobacteriota bacterium]